MIEKVKGQVYDESTLLSVYTMYSDYEWLKKEMMCRKFNFDKHLFY